MTIIGIVVVLALIGNFVGDKDKEKSPRSDEKSSSSSGCGRDDLQCWGDRLSIAAGFKCAVPVERLAKYELKWTDGWLEPKFPRFRWKGSDHSVVTLIGDRAKMSNGFGAFSNVIYECDMEVLSETVLDVRAREGRIGD